MSEALNTKKLEADLWESADLLQGRLQTDLKPVLHACPWPVVPALCIQPVQESGG